MGFQCLRVALCFVTAAMSASCGDDDGQCGRGPSLLQHEASLFRAKHTPFEEQRWAQAVQEEGLQPTSISEFGRAVPKFPRSVVVKLAALAKATPKRHTYNFMGRLRGAQKPEFDYGFKEMVRRAWVIPFVLHNFSDHDYFKVTDPKPWFNNTLGKFDYSRFKRVRPKEGDPASLVDLAYFETLAASNFTLCPGGDTPWSIRSYEVALMGSICLIRNPNEDWNPTTALSYTADGHKHMARLWAMYRYQLLDETPHVFDQALADHNFRVFKKYQTFMEGDNTPPPHGAGGEI